MKHLLHYLKKEVSYTSDTGTIYIDLPKDAQIAMIMLEIDATVSSTVDVTNSILICVEKIHVLLDGAKIAYSMQPEVGNFDYLLRSGKFAPNTLSGRPTAEDVMRLPILFGRYLGDPDYGLDMRRYASGQIEIEYTLDTTDYDTTTLDLTAYILVPAEPVDWKGFIRARIIEDKAAPTASSDHEVNFPSTFPLLAAFARIYDLDQYPTTNVTDLDFQAEQGRHRIFDGRIEDLIEINKLIFGGYLEGPTIQQQPTSGDYPTTFMGYAKDFRVTAFTASDAHCHVTSWKGHRCKVDMNISARPFFITPIGAMPWGCLLLGDWRDGPFDAKAHADLKCFYTIGSTAPEYLTTCVLEVVEGVL